jgi:hypothetical protein
METRRRPNWRAKRARDDASASENTSPATSLRPIIAVAPSRVQSCSAVSGCPTRRYAAPSWAWVAFNALFAAPPMLVPFGLLAP